MIIESRECDYIIKNIKAVNALIESYKLAKERIPGWLSKQITKKIEQRKLELPTDIEKKWLVEEEPGEICLIPNSYYTNEYGFYYGIENFNWDCLSADSIENSLWIYLYCYWPEKTPKNMKDKLSVWKKNISKLTEKNKPRLLDKYQVLPDQDDTYFYLVTYPLYDILNTETLGTDPEKAIKDTVDSMITFVKDTQDLLISL